MIIRQGLVCVWVWAVGKNLFMRYQMGRNVTLFDPIVRQKSGEMNFAWPIIAWISLILLNCTGKKIIWHLWTFEDISKFLLESRDFIFMQKGR